MTAPLSQHRVIPYLIPVHVPFAIATQTLPCAEGCFVQISNAHGEVGLGEAAPFPVLTQDDAAAAERHARELLEILQGLGAGAALTKLESLRPESFRRSRTAYVGVESALWDLLAKEQKVPLAQLWGTHGGTSLTTDITLPIMAPANIARFWDKFKDHNFPVVKIKVSGRVQDDLELVLATRSNIDPKIRITLDGNQGVHVDSARALVDALMRHDVRPDFFEQPLAAKDHKGLAKLSECLPIPVCVDETVETAEDAATVARERLASIINLKIMKSSIAETRAIIGVAQKAGLQLMIGGMLETEVAMGVSLQLSCGTGAVTYVDLDTPFFMTQPSTEVSPWAERSARLVCPTNPGHGMSLKQN